MFLCWGESDLNIAFSTHPGSQASSRGEAKDTALLSSRDVLGDLMDCSLPGSSIHGIFQARVLEWGAIAFSHRALQLHDWPLIPEI